jgi:hypothetical protein
MSSGMLLPQNCIDVGFSAPHRIPQKNYFLRLSGFVRDEIYFSFDIIKAAFVKTEIPELFVTSVVTHMSFGVGTSSAIGQPHVKPIVHEKKSFKNPFQI